VTATKTEFHVVERKNAEVYWELDTLARILGDGDRTGGAFCMVEFLQAPGFATPLHAHHETDEIFYVIDGTMHGICDGREWFAHEGAFVWLPKGSVHGWAVYGDAGVRSLAMTVPAGFDKFVRETGTEPATLTTPPKEAIVSSELAMAVGRKYDIEILGPPVHELN
jgi:quercetin dioxygenase-like cupin family protein